MKTIVMQDILGKNEEAAAHLKKIFSERKIFAINLLGSPGSGKTSLLEATLTELDSEMRIAVIEGDLFTTRDADRIERCEVPVVQINTSGGCHLDARMVHGALDEIHLAGLDLLIIENVGNLVCPAEFALGEDAKATVLSVTEGTDKPMKYPLIFKESAVTLINKTDLIPYTDFDIKQATEDIMTLHPEAAVFGVSSKTGEGLDAWYDWIRARVREKKS